MKKFFTLIAAVALAASVNAQTFKSFEKTTVFITNQENVTAGIAEGWIAEGSGKTVTTKTVVLIRRLVKKRYISSLVLI